MTDPSGQRFRVLVVDDDRTNCERLLQLLGDEGYDVDVAFDGLVGLEKIRERAPDLVVLDVMMPKMNGLELCRIIKQSLGELFLPVILVTVKGDIDSKVQGLKMGADDYLAKPYNPIELKARIGALLRIKELQDRVNGKRKALEDLSFTDGMTGIYNHRYLQQRMSEEFKRAQRYNDPLSCVMVDLDHFKQANDTHGHPYGDFVLKETSEILKRCVRDHDVVTRYGGDEFLIILPRTHFTGSLAVAERMWKMIGACGFESNGTSTHLTASIGISFYPNKNVAGPEQLIAHADEALYKAKRDGRNKICLYQHYNYFYQPNAESE
jgi:two-component system, cell cycle response regulator